MKRVHKTVEAKHKIKRNMPQKSLFGIIVKKASDLFKQFKTHI